MPIEINGLQSLDNVPVPARGDRNDYPLGTVLGNYLYVGDKPGGVEPGFLGIEINQALVDRFNQRFGSNTALKFKNPDAMRKGLGDLTQTVSYIDNQGNAQNMPLSQALEDFAKDLKAECKNKTKPSDLTMWLMKQDYHDGEFMNLVAPPISRLEKTNAIKSMPESTRGIFAAMYKAGRLFQSSRNQESTNAILECAANDVATMRGMEVQNQHLILGTYLNGDPKLMTACVWEPRLEMMEDRLAGSKNKNDYEGYITEKHDKTQAARIEGGAEALALAYVMFDRDFFGSKLQNKGLIVRERVDAEGNSVTESHLYGFDFGHAYREENQVIKTLSDDFSFVQPDDPNKKLKNISALTDAPLSEKMLGIFYMYQLADRKMIDKLFSYDEQINIQKAMNKYADKYPEFKVKIQHMVEKESKEHQVFDSYKQKFTELAQAAQDRGDKKAYKQYMGYIDQIQLAQKRSETATAAMLGIFKSRMQLAPDKVDLLENLERLTSVVSPYSSDQTVKLNHLRILPTFKSRWQMVDSQNSADKVILSTKLPDQRLRGTRKELETYLAVFRDIPGNPISSLEIKTVGSELQIHINAKQLPALCEFMNEEYIRTYKGLDEGVTEQKTQRANTSPADIAVAVNRLRSSSETERPSINISAGEEAETQRQAPKV